MSSLAIAALAAKVKDYLDLVAVYLKEKAPRVATSHDADTLEGSTIPQLKTEVDPLVAAHVADKNNPHNVRPDQLGSYSKAEVDNLLSRRVRSGLIPVSRFGSLDYELPDITNTGWVIHFNEETPCLLSGRYAALAPVGINLTTVKANPGDTTFYVYVQIEGITASYQILEELASETDMYMFIGTITTGASAVSTIDIKKFTKFGGYRLSSTPQGQSIPVTTGLPSREAHLDPGWF